MDPMEPTYALLEWYPPRFYSLLATFADPVEGEAAQRVLGMRHPLRRFMLAVRSPDDPAESTLPPEPPAGTLESLSPESAALGSPSFTLHVYGQGFTPQSVIYWNNSPEPTTFVSENEVTTGVNMDTAGVAMQIPVSVDSGDAMLRGVQSNVLIFTLTGGQPMASSAFIDENRPREQSRRAKA